MTLGKISKKFAIRTETILNLVLKLQVDRACFQRERKNAHRKKVEEWEKKKKKKERIWHSQ